MGNEVLNKEKNYMTKDDFIKRSTDVHGNKYNYSLVVYSDCKTPVDIICPEHGVFRQRPEQHYKGRGCPICGIVKSSSKRKLWTKDTITIEAQKYETQVDFRHGSGGAYMAAQRYGMLKDLQSLWKKDTKPRGYWTIEKSKEVAKLCINRHELRKKYAQAYRVLSNNNLLDEFFVNEKDKDAEIHCVYQFYFPKTNAIYIGRTLKSRVEKREKEHQQNKKSTVLKYSVETNQPVPRMQIIFDNLNCNESLAKEDEEITKAKENGFIVLNKAKTGIKSGSIGAIGFGKLTYNYCYEIAKKCKTKHEFELKDASAYLKANQKGWSKDYIWFKEIHKPKGYWDNYYHCYEEFLRCDSSIERLRKENSSCYKYSVKNGYTKSWHKKRVAPNKKWTYQALSEIVKKYPHQAELQKYEGGAYNALRKMDLLYEFYSKQNDKPNGYWNVFENIEKEAKKYKSRWDFGKNNRSAYNAARRNNWLDKLFSN